MCTRLAGLFSVNATQRPAINLMCACILLMCGNKRQECDGGDDDDGDDVPLLPNSVRLPVVLLMAVGSGSVEKVAKTFPKIIQAVKKLMFSFPILLSLLFCSSEPVQQSVSWTAAVYPRGLKEEKMWRGVAVWG